MAAINISQEDLSSFHAAHFSTPSLEYFSEQYLGPVEETYEEEEDDGLGYYPDGKKRTLTDEQIAIFRHSEIEALLRERRHAREAKHDRNGDQASEPGAEEGEIEDGEVGHDSPIIDTPTPTSTNSDQPNKQMNRRQKKAQKAREKGYFKANIKPDLRKRTWDKVETGMGNLDYDEMEEAASSAPSRPSQRRRVTYGDD